MRQLYYFTKSIAALLFITYIVVVFENIAKCNYMQQQKQEKTSDNTHVPG